MVVNFQAHPRSRGENDSHAPSSHEDSGSSPLTRGKLSQRLHLGKIGGLIPAHAGKTKIAQFSQFSPPAHPRSRGENDETLQGGGEERGSSPLTRGKHGGSMKDALTRGLIPAHAGKTPRMNLSPGLATAHPRSRGENASSLSFMSSRAGSSPLTRGKPCW